jgi:hypothetical protein
MGSAAVVAILKEIGTLVCVPVLLVIAWRDWIRNVRAVMPPWRNGIALTAVLILSVHWFIAMLLDAPELFHGHLALMSVEWASGFLAHPLDVAAVIFAFALKGRPRLEVILAGMFLLSCWPGGYT